jgi:hypothetical protein
LDVAKDIWTTLQMTHEGSKSVRKTNVEMLEGQLNRFIMYDDEIYHKMFNRLKKIVNKVRALGSKKWIDRILIERLMMAYTPMNYNVMILIRQDPVYKKMTSDDMLGRIKNYEMNIQEANNIKNISNGVSTSKKQDIALKANKSKKMKVLIESPSEKEEEEEEEKDNDKRKKFDKGYKKGKNTLRRSLMIKLMLAKNET